MPLRIQCRDNIYGENQNITISGSNYCFVPNKKFSKGKRYFELTHYEGNCNYMTGFNSEKGYASFYPSGSLSKTLFWFERSFGTGGSTSNNLVPGLSLNYGYTIGIGIDIDTSEFFIFHENFYYSHSFNTQAPGSKFEFFIRHSNNENANDVISLNFGTSPFKHNIPNFRLIGNNMKYSCRRKNRELIALVFIETFALTVK